MEAFEALCFECISVFKIVICYIMRLVFLSHSSDCTGGAQRCLLDLLKGLKQNHPEWQIYVVFPGQGDLVDACSAYISGYKILRMRWWLVGGNGHIGIGDKLVYARKLFKYSIKLARYLKQIKPDYGITNTIVLPHLACACKFLKIRHCWFLHEIPDATWQDNGFIFKSQSVFKLVDKLSAKVWVTSEYAKCYYQNIMTGGKVHVITQAVELQTVLGVNKDRSLHDRYTLLLVGAFDSNKGQMELLQAVKSIVDKEKDIFCYLVGPDYGFISICEDYIKKNGLSSSVRIVPFVKQIYPYYYLADVLLVCSAFETFGRVAVEAQKCGLPVILSDVGANLERIENGINGLLYQKGDIMDLVEKIELLRDTTVRNTFSKNINLVMLEEKYSSDYFASNFAKLLNL